MLPFCLHLIQCVMLALELPLIEDCMAGLNEGILNKMAQ